MLLRRRQKLICHGGVSNFDSAYKKESSSGLPAKTKAEARDREHIFIHVSIAIKQKFVLFDLSLTFQNVLQSVRHLLFCDALCFSKHRH